MNIQRMILVFLASIIFLTNDSQAASQKEQRIRVEDTIKIINNAFKKTTKDQENSITNLKNILTEAIIPQRIAETLKTLYGKDTDTKKIFSYNAAQETFKQLTDIFTNFVENPEVNIAIKLIGIMDDEQQTEKSLIKIIQDLNTKIEQIKNKKFTRSDYYYTRYAAELLLCYGANILHAITQKHDLQRLLPNQMEIFQTIQNKIKKIADEEREKLGLTKYSSEILS